MVISMDKSAPPNQSHSSSGPQSSSAAPPEQPKPDSAFNTSSNENSRVDRARNAAVKGGADIDENNAIRKDSGQSTTDYSKMFEQKMNEEKQGYKEAGFDKDNNGMVDKDISDTQKNSYHQKQKQPMVEEREKIAAQGGDTKQLDAKIAYHEAMQCVYGGKPKEGLDRLGAANQKIDSEIDSLQSKAKSEQDPEKKKQLLNQADNLMWQRLKNDGSIIGIEGKYKISADPKEDTLGKTLQTEIKAIGDDQQQNDDIRTSSGQAKGDYKGLTAAKIQEEKKELTDAGLDKNNDGSIDKDVSTAQLTDYYKSKEQGQKNERDKVAAQGGDTKELDAKIEYNSAMQDVLGGNPQKGIDRLNAANQKIGSDIDNLQEQAKKEQDPEKKNKLLEQADNLNFQRMKNMGSIVAATGAQPNDKSK